MTATIGEVQARLPELLAQLPPGEEIAITRDHRVVARLIAIEPEKPQAVFGSCRGKMTIISDDDDHLQDFAEYMS